MRFGQFRQDGHHRQAADEFGNEPKCEQVFRFNVMQNLVAFDFGQLPARVGRVKSHDAMTEATLDDLFEANKRAAANEQNPSGVDANVFLLRMFATALRRNIANRAFQNL